MAHKALGGADVRVEAGDNGRIHGGSQGAGLTTVGYMNGHSHDVCEGLDHERRLP